MILMRHGATLFSALMILFLSSCGTTQKISIVDWKADPELESGIAGAMFDEWLKQSGASSEWSTSCLVYSSRPVYLVRAGTLSVKPAKPNQEAKSNYSAHGSEKDKTRMIVKGNMMAERKREYALIDLGFLRLIPWSGKSEYIKVPLDFTYYSSCPPEKVKMLGRRN